MSVLSMVRALCRFGYAGYYTILLVDIGYSH